MLLQKTSIMKWAKEVYRCENIISTSKDTEEINKAKWKVDAIMNVFAARHPDKLFDLIMAIDKLFLNS